MLLPDSITGIGVEFFMSSGIKSIIIPNSVKRIGSGAFGSCKNLSSITIPSSVIKIDEYAFKNCKHLTYIKCLAVEPPILEQPNFEIPIYYVPAESVEKYKSAEGWKYCNIQPIGKLIVIATATYDRPTPNSDSDKTTCYIEFMGKEQNSETADELILNFIERKYGCVVDTIVKKIRRYDYQHYISIHPQYLMKTYSYYILPDGRNILYDINYSVHGSGVKYDTPGIYTDTGENRARKIEMKQHDNLSQNITREFYIDLKEVLQNDIGYKIENDYKQLTWEEYHRDSIELERKNNYFVNF